MKSPNPQAHQLVFGVQVTWVALVAVLVQLGVLYWYLSGAWRTGRRGRRWPLARAACWTLGVAITAYTVEGGIAGYQRDNFTLNAIRCLLLVDVAPALLALGAPLRLALRSGSRRSTEVLLRLLEGRPGRLLAHPLFSFGFATVSLYVYFLTPLYRLAAEHPLLAGYVDLHLVVCGLIFWAPVAGADPSPRALTYPRRFFYAVAAVPFNIALGAAVASTSHPLYPAGNTLVDTQNGGNVFWELAQVMTVAVLALLLVSFAMDEERRAIALDVQMEQVAAPEAAPGETGQVVG